MWSLCINNVFNGFSVFWNFISFCSLESRIALREELQCKPFSWYLTHVYPDLRVPDAEDISFGSIRQGSLCLDTLGHLSDGLVGLYSCHGAGGNQDWSFTKNGHIKHGSDLCVALDAPRPSANLRLRLCSNSPLQVKIRLRFLWVSVDKIEMEPWFSP